MLLAVQKPLAGKGRGEGTAIESSTGTYRPPKDRGAYVGLGACALKITVGGNTAALERIAELLTETPPAL